MIISQGHGGTSMRREEKDGTSGELAPKVFPMKQSRLHNFSFPTMNWGCQRILRCVNSTSDMGSTAPRSTTSITWPQRERNAAYSPISSLPKSPQAGGYNEKETKGTTTGTVMENDTKKMNASSAAAEGAIVAPAIPWNLRKRKATCYSPHENGRKSYCCSSPSKPTLGKDDLAKSAMLGTMVGENGQRRKFSISLSRKEIEEDFYMFKGMKPNPRPKKRSKDVQKQLDALFPGSLLTEITKDMYKIVK